MARKKEDEERATPEQGALDPVVAREPDEPTAVPQEQRAEYQTAELTKEQQKQAKELQERVRVDGAGRTLNPWEVSPEDQVFAVVTDESKEERKAREVQAEYDQEVEAARAQQQPLEGATTAGGVGTAVGGPATTGGTAPGTAGV